MTTGKATLYAQADELLGVIAKYQRLKLDIPKKSDLSSEIALMRQQLTSWEPLMRDLSSFSPEVLEYTATLMRTREGLVGRRVQAFLGPARGNGMVGVLVSAFASAGALSFARTLFPNYPAVWFGGGFLVILSLLLYLSYGMIQIAHSASKLLVIAEILEVTAKMKRQSEVEFFETVREGVH